MGRARPAQSSRGQAEAALPLDAATGMVASMASGGEEGQDLKTRIAWLYHVEGLTQDEVARELGLHRSRVLRILAQARADGTVQVRVTTRLSACVALERRLERTWGLRRAVVIPEPQDPRDAPAIIGAELGQYLSAALGPGMTLGLGWGETLTRGLPAIEPRGPEGVRVLSMLGGLTRVSAVNPSEFAWRVADRISAECHLMAAPVFAPDPATARALKAHAGIAEIFARARQLDLAVLSVGALAPRSIFTEYGLLSREEVASLERAGAVGDVLCHFVDAEGRVVDHPVNERVIAVDPATLRATREIVLASGGWEKRTVIRAALKLLRPAALITDQAVAEALVAEAPP